MLSCLEQDLISSLQRQLGRLGSNPSKQSLDKAKPEAAFGFNTLPNRQPSQPCCLRSLPRLSPLFPPRSNWLRDLKLPVQSRFSLSLIFEKLTPSILMNITHLAGYLDDETNHLSTIMNQIHSKMHYTPSNPFHCLPYQRLCESQIQVAAAKSLQGILFNESVIKLLDYRALPKEAVVAGDYVDKSALVVAVGEVLRCVIARAIKPSPLKMALRPMEMERIYSIVSYECLGAVSECKYYIHMWKLSTCNVQCTGFSYRGGHPGISPPLLPRVVVRVYTMYMYVHVRIATMYQCILQPTCICTRPALCLYPLSYHAGVYTCDCCIYIYVWACTCSLTHTTFCRHEQQWAWEGSSQKAPADVAADQGHYSLPCPPAPGHAT